MNAAKEWWNNAVIYQIYPRSFKDSNGDGVGDLRGIQSKLDYLVELGIDAVWISPIYPSPMADFGYDVSDYIGIHPVFGTMEDFDDMLAAAHHRGLRVILDYVPNHTSIEHPWFKESRSNRKNPKRDWYIWKDPAPRGGPPNNWEAITGSSAWNFDALTGQYYLSQFIKDEPDLNWRNPQVAAAMQKVLRFWLDKGVDGFRMDMLPHLVEHPDFPDNPPIPLDHPFAEFGLTQDQFFTTDQPETHRIIKEFRKIFESYGGDRVIIGETPLFDMKQLAGYYGENLDEVHIPFNFKLLLTPWNAGKMKEVLDEYYAVIPNGAIPSIVFGNHDFSRLATRFGKNNVRSAAFLLLTLWGVPTIYYGDEIGMEDGMIPASHRQDPWNRSGTGRDPERTPMQWESSPNGGFCTAEAEPWLPVNSNFNHLNVAIQNEDQTSLLNLFRKLLMLRHKISSLNRGGIEFLEAPDDMLIFLRSYADEKVLVIVNFNENSRVLNFSSLGKQGEELISTNWQRTGSVDLAELPIDPHESIVIQLRVNKD